jgi:uncharacterized membrane protein
MTLSRRLRLRQRDEDMHYLERAALAGIATGMRSTSAVAALTLANSSGLPRLLTGPVPAGMAGIGVTSELILDKLPTTPSRLQLPGLAGRAVLAGIAGAVLARETKHAMLPAVLAASVAALFSARAGHDIRQAAAAHVSPSGVAAVEDALALTIAAAAARDRRTRLAPGV